MRWKNVWLGILDCWSVEYESLMIALSFFCLLLPYLGVRFCIFYPQNRYRVAHFFGLAQDLLICLSGLICYLWLIPYLPFTITFLIAFIFILFSTGIMLLDGFLFLKTSIRLEPSFLEFLDDLRCFWDSAKERGFIKYLPIFFGGMAIPGYVFFLSKDNLICLSSHLLWRCWLAVACIAVIGMCFIPKEVAYITESLLIRHLVLWIRKQVSKLKKPVITPNPKAFVACNEINTPFFPEQYPLFRTCTGFTGEKLWDFKIHPGEQPHVVLLVLESFRAKTVGALGNALNITPHFDRLTERGVLFTNFYANSVKTSRSVTSLLSGIPSDISSKDRSTDRDLSLVSLAHILKSHGYNTAYLHNGCLEFENQKAFLLKQGFANLFGQHDILQRFPYAPLSSWGLPDEHLMRFTADWLEAQQDPTFLTMYTITNHHPWKLPAHCSPLSLPKHYSPAYRRYLSTFQYSDFCLGLLISLFEQKGLSKNTVFIVTGDHGQPMGEREGNYMVQKGLYEENIHVPLLFYGENRCDLGARIDAIGSHMDVLPTVMDLLQLQASYHTTGKSLMRRSEETRKTFFHNPYVHGYFGMRENQWKYVFTKTSRQSALYDLITDRQEAHNIALKYPKVCSHMLNEVLQYKRTIQHLYKSKAFAPVA